MYELVDHTSDETYWTLGAFETIEEAVTVIDSKFSTSDGPLRSGNTWDDDYVVLEIRELPKCLGRSERVWQRRYHATWDDERDDATWSVAETQTFDSPTNEVT
ncbi:MAG: hypothetical protein AAGJ40_09585 [Planctomycetota bacterium]